jgi:hypothetical protein
MRMSKPQISELPSLPQDHAIYENLNELYDIPSNGEPAKMPFAYYLRQTPAQPLSIGTKVLLWTIGVLVVGVLLFALVHASTSRSSKSRIVPRTEHRRAGMPVFAERANRPVPAALSGGKATGRAWGEEAV